MSPDNFLGMGRRFFGKHIVLTIILTALAILDASAQEEEAIRWEPGQRLSWSNFKGKPPESTRIAATTASGISYRYKTRSSGRRYLLDFEVDTYFYPNKSWYHAAVCDANVLSHEQLHFDISELFAREFRRRLNSRTFSENVKAEVRAMFRQINKELSEFQNRYDQETDYSRNRAAQQVWNREIAEILERD